MTNDKTKAVQDALEDLPQRDTGVMKKPILLSLTRDELEIHRTALAVLDAMCKEGWVPTADRLPEKPGKQSYEYVDCLIKIKGEIQMRPWNCEHLCWDDVHYDDHEYDATEPTHWKPIESTAEKLVQQFMEGK